MSVAVITGAAGGLGASVAQALAQDGLRLALLDLSAESLEPLCNTLEADGVERPLALACDVSSAESVADAAERVAHDAGPCTVLVNNAAIYQRALLEDHSLELWDSTIAVNLRGYFLCTREFGRTMIERRSGSIVNVSSIAAIGPTPGAVSYCASKAAIVMLTKQTALEWGQYGVRANAVSPGFMSTPMSSAFGDESLVAERRRRVPVGRIGTTDEVADVVRFLASPEASYVSGVNVVVDGGLTQTLSQTFPRPAIN